MQGPRGQETSLLADIEENAETYLPEVVATPPGRLAVSLVPALDPDASPWAITLRRLGSSASPRRAQADREGRVTLDSIPQGSYQLQVATHAGNRVEDRETLVDGDRALEIHLPLVRFEGRVRMSGQPLAASLSLESGDSDRANVVTDTEGRFEGWMRRPKMNFLLAQIEWGAPPVSRQLEVTDFDRGAEVLKLDLNVPSSRITGDVVDADTVPVAGVDVVARPTGGSYLHTETGADGRFELAGLEPHRYSVWAVRKDEFTSKPVEAQASPGGTPVRIVLGRDRNLAGRIQSPDGGAIPRAVIILDTVGDGERVSPIPTAEDGSFEVTVPADARLAHLQVQAPSHLLWAGCVALPRIGAVGGHAPLPARHRAPAADGLSQGHDRRGATQRRLACRGLLSIGRGLRLQPAHRMAETCLRHSAGGRRRERWTAVL